MTTYYVSLSGNDANNGTTLDSAWRHINYAVDHVSAGDTIYVVPGNYGAEHVTITTSGTESNPIKITRYGTSGMITLKHNIERTGIGIRVYGNYWIIEHFDVSDYQLDLYIDGDYNTINFVEAHGETNYGLTVAPGGDYNVFNKCTAYDMPRGVVSNEANGFKIAGDYNLIKDCKAYNIGHFGIAISRAGGGPVGNVVDGGEYWNMYGDTAIVAGYNTAGGPAAGATNTIFKNIFVHDTDNGIRTYFGSVNTTIENCTITNMTDRDGIAMYGSGIVRNNVIRNWNLYGTWVSGVSADEVIFEGNDMQDIPPLSPEYRFTTWLSPDYIGVIKNQKGSSFTINIAEYAGATEPATVRIEYTDGRTFSINGAGDYTSYTLNSVGTYNIEVISEVSDLVGLWRFNEGEGTTAVDSSGQGNDGTLTNMNPATDWVDGKLGKALRFDGNDDYVDYGTSASLIFNDSDPWTFEHWIKWVGQQDKSYVIYAGLGSDVREYFVIKNNGDNRFVFKDKNMDSHYFVSGSSSPYIDKWTHLTWIADGNGNLKLYINGEYYDTLSSVPTQMHFYRIGRGYYNNDYNFKGTIDEVSIYNRALSAAEIKTIYEQACPKVLVTFTSVPMGAIVTVV